MLSVFKLPEVTIRGVHAPASLKLSRVRAALALLAAIRGVHAPASLKQVRQTAFVVPRPGPPTSRRRPGSEKENGAGQCDHYKA